MWVSAQCGALVSDSFLAGSRSITADIASRTPGAMLAILLVAYAVTTEREPGGRE
jgi:hypothetical protein